MPREKRDALHPENSKVNGETAINRADLSTRIEIKTLYGASTEATFKSHIKQVVGKQDVRFVIVDVSENKSSSDNQAEAWMREYMKRYGIAEVRMLRHDGTLKNLKK